MTFKKLKTSFQHRYTTVSCVFMVLLLILPFQAYTSTCEEVLGKIDSASERSVESYKALRDKIENLDIDFGVRKKALFTLMEWSANPKDANVDDINLDFLSHQLEFFSKEDQETIVAEISSWKEAEELYKRKFISKISQVLFSRDKQQIENVLDSKFGTLLDLNAIDESVLSRRVGNRWTPLLVALLRSNQELAQLLLNRGADINAKNEDGVTALMEVLYRGYPPKSVVKFLLENGADRKVKDNAGKTAFDYAKGSGHEELVRAFRRTGKEKLKSLIQRIKDSFS